MKKATGQKQGSNRVAATPRVTAMVQSVSASKLRRFIERHEGVVSAMAEDHAGMRAIGLETVGAALSRMTLTSRLKAIEIEVDGKPVLAHDFANAVRVKAGKVGPRGSRAAREAANLTPQDRAQIVTALASSRSVVAEAARRLNRPRHHLVKQIAALNITEQEIEARRVEIAKCQACAAEALGASAPMKHTCGK